MTLENKAEAELLRALGPERLSLPAAEEQLRLLLDVSLIGVCSCDLAGRVLEANDPFMRMLGITREEVRARTIDLIELALPSRRAAALEARRRIVEEGALEAWETELVRPDGKRVPVLLSGARLPWRATAVMFAQDLSEARRKEAALQSAEERLSLLLEAMPAVLFEFDASGAIAFLAGAEESAAQRGPGALTDAGWAAEPAVAALVQRALAGEELRARVGRGGRLFDLALRPRRASPGGPVTAVVGAGREVTTSVQAETQLLEERRRLQEWLAQEQQLEGLGVLASGLAHTFNNLLTGILANASASLHALPPGADASALEDSVISASRAALLARQLLRNALPAPAETPLVDLSARLREMASLLGAVLPQRARLELELAEALPGVRIHPAQLRRVLLPLVTGAIDATRSQGGVIRISTRLVELGPGHALLGGDRLEPGWYASVQVFDDGPAINGAALAELESSLAPGPQARAEPPALDGRTLGLLAVLGSMRARLGGVRLQSESGVGSAIELLYPVSSAPPPQRPLIAPADPAPTREVLLIDDDPIVRRAAARILRSRGLAIAQASSGDEAMELLRSGAIHPGAVILDFAMPGMNGGQTLRALQQLRPQMRIILCSGYSLEEVSPSIDLAMLSGYLPKPFTSAALQEAVLRALDGVTPSAPP